jgi:hypothetical protein
MTVCCALFSCFFFISTSTPFLKLACSLMHHFIFDPCSVVPTKFYNLSDCPESSEGIEIKFRAKAAGLYVLSWMPENPRGLTQMEYGVSVDGVLGEQTADSP